MKQLISKSVKVTDMAQGAGWPSTTGNPSGGDRDNNPPKGK